MPTNISVIVILSESATIQWILTDPFNPIHPDTFTVLYGDKLGYFNFSTREINAEQGKQTYTVQLTSLQPETQYFYKIRSKIIAELNEVDTDVMSLVTRKIAPVKNTLSE